MDYENQVDEELLREDQEYENNLIRHEEARERLDRRGRSCADGYCGADDCETCRPGCTRFMAEMDPDVV